VVAKTGPHNVRAQKLFNGRMAFKLSALTDPKGSLWAFAGRPVRWAAAGPTDCPCLPAAATGSCGRLAYIFLSFHLNPTENAFVVLFLAFDS